MGDSSERQDFADLWLRDGMQAWRFVPTFFAAVEADMTIGRETIASARASGTRLTYTHLIVHAAAKALAANPDLHRVVCGGRRYRPERVDIALSVGGDDFAAPTMILEDAAGKGVYELAQEITRRIPETREKGRRDRERLRRFGWILPFGFMRRAAIRVALRSFAARRKLLGTFQISMMPDVDFAATAMFGTASMLMAGRVKDRPAVIDGQLAIRPTVMLTCCADHRVFDGRAAARLLNAIKSSLESR